MDAATSSCVSDAVSCVAKAYPNYAAGLCLSPDIAVCYIQFASQLPAVCHGFTECQKAKKLKPGSNVMVLQYAGQFRALHRSFDMDHTNN